MSIYYTGLSAEQVADSRQKFGANIIHFPMQPSLTDKISWVNQSWQIRLLLGINFSILLFISFVKMMRISILYDMWTILLIFTVLLVFSYLVILMSAHWNEGMRRLEIDPLVNVWILLLGISGIITSHQNVYNNEVGFAPYIPILTIAIVLLLMTGISCWIEYSNNKLFRQITQQKDLREVKVIRNGNVVIIPRKEIVVHDVIILQKGDEIPADAYLLDSCDMLVNESIFTGTSRCLKSTNHADFDFDATFATNYVVGGSWVLDGEAIVEVCAVGNCTVAAKTLQGHGSENVVNQSFQMALTPLNKGLTRITYLIAILIVVWRISMYVLNHNIMVSFAAIDWMMVVDYLVNTILMAVTLLVIVVASRLPTSLIVNYLFRMIK